MKTPEQIINKIESLNFTLDSMQFHAKYDSYIMTLLYFRRMLGDIEKEPYKEFKIKGIEEAIKFMIEDGA